MRSRFESDTGEEPWTRVVTQGWDSTDEPFIFELDEPVQKYWNLPHMDPARIWWIERFFREDVTDRSRVRLRSTQRINASTSYFTVSVLDLVKLPAMLRIAVEASE